VISATGPKTFNLGFLDRSRYFFIQVAPQLSSRGLVDTVRDLSLKESGSVGNRTRNLSVCGQELLPLDYRDYRAQLHRVSYLVSYRLHAVTVYNELLQVIYK
jgi:hypothetical protein